MFILLTTLIVHCPVDPTNGKYRLNITTINGAGTEIWNSNNIYMTNLFKFDGCPNLMKKYICTFLGCC